MSDICHFESLLDSNQGSELDEILKQIDVEYDCFPPPDSDEQTDNNGYQEASILSRTLSYNSRESLFLLSL